VSATQRPPQLVVPVPQSELQTPVLQVAGAVQARPHMPQLAVLVLVSTQAVPQSVWPVGQRQAPAWQVCAAGQAVPQRPQLASSVIVSTQAAPQAVRPVGQRHAPIWQVWPPEHAVPQAPQLALSLWTSRHTVMPPTMHSRRGATQVDRHAPPMQAWPAGHTVPQAPQLALSVIVLAQEATPMAVQRVWPAGQAGGWQTPIAQVSPAAQAVPQAPQLAVLAWRSTHIGVAAIGAQSVWPEGHIRGATQAPAVHA